VVLRGNRFVENRIGIRCLKSSPVIEQNEFVDNLTGIFFREGVANPVLRHNNFDNREYDLKLGEAQGQDVDAAGNWWASAAKGAPEDRIFDGGDSEGIGFAATDPVLTQPWGRERKR
jgi:nitrous oxidase accessory protein NosD